MSEKKLSRTRVKRRAVLKGGAAATAAAAVGPWVVSPKVLASSGEVNVLMWSDYLPPGFLKSFKEKTGITVNYTGIGSNEEIINKMKVTKGEGIDIASPTNMRSLQWVDLGVLQPFDYGRIKNIKNVNPAMLKVGDEEWNFGGKGSHWLPHIWGTEGVAWRTDLWTPPRAGEIPSYGDVWQPDVKGKTMMRPHSGMLGAGLYLETTGKLAPGAMKKAYGDEATMRKTWEVVTKFCIENKAQIKLFWNDADTQKNGLLNEGVLVGQTWDGPPITLMNDGEPVQYRAPAEGSLAWVDGMSLSAKAGDLDAVYAFIDYCFEPEPAGMSIDGGKAGDKWGGHGYNSAVIGADKYASAQYAKVFQSVYPGNSLANLWPWPKEPQWYADVRTEFRNRFVNA
ncbi:MAG: extracellular solute-binding protein [Gammaproteobacteria bacterium]|nr:extracellular solute-binding protein [Gammaproteobacteria bacterium]